MESSGALFVLLSLNFTFQTRFGVKMSRTEMFGNLTKYLFNTSTVKHYVNK